MPALLGTWHGGGMEEKWAKGEQPVSGFGMIQGLILVDDPMFNEPGFDGTLDGRGRHEVTGHNEEIRLYMSGMQ